MSVAVDLAARVQRLVKGPLRGVDIDVPVGRLTAVVGRSGAGKSTLVNCVGGLSRPESGRIWVGGQEVNRLPESALTRVRRDRIGFIFAGCSLLPLSVEQNIRIGHELAGRRPDRSWFDTVVRLLDLSPLLKTHPKALSAVERQRVACARAFLSRPDVVLADEPTGELDQRDAGELLGFLRMWVRKLNQSVLLVTSSPRVAAHADQVFVLRHGHVEGRIERPTVGLVTAALERP